MKAGIQKLNVKIVKSQVLLKKKSICANLYYYYLLIYFELAKKRTVAFQLSTCYIFQRYSDLQVGSL